MTEQSVQTALAVSILRFVKPAATFALVMVSGAPVEAQVPAPVTVEQRIQLLAAMRDCSAVVLRSPGKSDHSKNAVVDAGVVLAVDGLFKKLVGVAATASASVDFSQVVRDEFQTVSDANVRLHLEHCYAGAFQQSQSPPPPKLDPKKKTSKITPQLKKSDAGVDAGVDAGTVGLPLTPSDGGFEPLELIFGETAGGTSSRDARCWGMAPAHPDVAATMGTPTLEDHRVWDFGFWNAAIARTDIAQRRAQVDGTDAMVFCGFNSRAEASASVALVNDANFPRLTFSSRCEASRGYRGGYLPARCSVAVHKEWTARVRHDICAVVTLAGNDVQHMLVEDGSFASRTASSLGQGLRLTLNGVDIGVGAKPVQLARGSEARLLLDYGRTVDAYKDDQSKKVTAEYTVAIVAIRGYCQ